MASLTDILSAIQNGVVAGNNFAKQTTGTFNNINSQLTTLSCATATIPSTFVRTFNGRSSDVLPIQGDYPTALIPGTSTNNNATAGNLGEYISSVVPSTTPIFIASATNTNLTSINISAGDWELRGSLGVLPSSQISSFIVNI